MTHQPPSEERLSDQEVEAAAHAWQLFLEANDWKSLMDMAGEPEEDDDGSLIYEVEGQESLPGDFAIVDMSRVKVDTPHFHVGETEVHLPLQGSALMSIGQERVELVPGSKAVILPLTPHFIVPKGAEDYIVGMLSLPGYNPDNQIPVDTANPPDVFDAPFFSMAKNK